jgi:hypothetical protein
MAERGVCHRCVMDVEDRALEASLRAILPHILEHPDVKRAEVDTSGIPQINIWLYSWPTRFDAAGYPLGPVGLGMSEICDLLATKHPEHARRAAVVYGGFDGDIEIVFNRK